MKTYFSREIGGKQNEDRIEAAEVGNLSTVGRKEGSEDTNEGDSIVDGHIEEHNGREPNLP